MRVLLTGATGFIGSHLVHRFSEAGHEVSAIVRPVSDLSAIAGVVPRGRCHFYERDFDSVERALRVTVPDVVVHLASLFISQHKAEDLPDLISSNVVFGTFLLEAMKAHGVRRFINTGTNWQHFQDSQYDPSNLYAATKKAFEDILQYYVQAHSVIATTLELTDTYGPDDKRRKIVNLLLQSIRTGKQIDISAGDQLMDLVHVDDAIEAYMLACDQTLSRDAGYLTYSVTSGPTIKLKDVVALMERVRGKRPPVNIGRRPYRHREIMSPWLQGKVVPGWKCENSLESFLREQLLSND